MQRLRTLHLFAGAGGGILADLLLGHQPVCAVEINQYCQKVLAARQEDWALPWFPIFADVTQFDGRPWRGLVDVVAGGFPCQDISAAGKGAGITGERSGLWVEMARIIGEVRPRYVFVENSPMLTVRGLGVVLADLASLGYDARWGVLGAVNVGAPHKRERIWIRAELANARCPGLATGRAGGREAPNGQVFDVRPANGGGDVANPNSLREPQPGRRKRDQRGWVGDGCESDTYADSKRLERSESERERNGVMQRICDIYGGQDWWKSEPDVGRVADGVAARVDRLKAIGNGQVPQCAAEAWRLLT